MIGQVKGDFETQKGNMKYLQKVKDLTSVFVDFKIQQVPRSKNSRADLLSKLATSAPRDLSQKSFFEILKKPSIEEPVPVL